MAHGFDECADGYSDVVGEEDKSKAESVDDLRTTKLHHDTGLSVQREEFFGHINGFIRLVKLLIRLALALVAVGVSLFLLFTLVQHCKSEMEWSQAIHELEQQLSCIKNQCGMSSGDWRLHDRSYFLKEVRLHTGLTLTAP